MIDTELIKRVDDIAPVVAAGKADAERRGRLCDEVVAAMQRAGFTKMYAPKALGGLEVDPVTVSRVTEDG